MLGRAREAVELGDDQDVVFAQTADRRIELRPAINRADLFLKDLRAALAFEEIADLRRQASLLAQGPMPPLAPIIIRHPSLTCRCPSIDLHHTAVRG